MAGQAVRFACLALFVPAVGCASGTVDMQEAEVLGRQAISSDTAEICGRPPASIALRRIHEDRYVDRDIMYVLNFDVSFDGSHVYDTAVEVSKTWRWRKENAADVQGGVFKCKDYM